jgi:hypothetical protein
MSARNPFAAIFLLNAIANAARQGGEYEPPSLEEMLFTRQKGQPIPSRREVVAKLLDDPDFQEQARLAGVSLDETTPGCDCEMCLEIARRNDAKSAHREQTPSGEAASKFNNTLNFTGAREIPEAAASRQTVPEILHESADHYEAKNPVYGDAYKRYGSTMMSFFPEGLYINEPDDWNRFGLFSMMVSKMNRIASNLTIGGHRDSSLDLATYAAMMTELTENK